MKKILNLQELQVSPWQPITKHPPRHSWRTTRGLQFRLVAPQYRGRLWKAHARCTRHGAWSTSMGGKIENDGRSGRIIQTWFDRDMNFAQNWLWFCYKCAIVVSLSRSVLIWTVPTQGVLHINVPFAGKFEEREVLVKFLRQEVFWHNPVMMQEILSNIDVFFCVRHGGK